VCLAAGLVAACSFDPGGSVGGAGGAADARVGPDAGRADAGGPCVTRCDGATLVECPGGVEQRTPCVADCSTAGGPHCADLVPSNGLMRPMLSGADGVLTVSDGEVVTFEADTGEIRLGAVPMRPPGEGLLAGINYIQGPPYHVFALRELHVERGGMVLIRATASTGGVTSPIQIYASGPVRIHGLVDITAGCADGTHWCAGVGGGNGGTSTVLPGGCAPGGEGGSDILFDETGGGGGGFGQNGAPGGDSGGALGGAGGLGNGCPGETLVPLDGGSGGDRGGEGGDGGGGGGGLQITSHDSIVVMPDGGGVPAGVWAGGDGGQGGGIFNGGGGGGSGGAVLLEAPVVTVAAGAILAANGGGGGEGDGTGPGQDGLLANAPAGGGGGMVVRHGGPGGYGTTPPQPGDGPGDGTGGGGGGAGRIRLNGRDVTAQGTISPPASIGGITVE
jgi:hypothetical protein